MCSLISAVHETANLVLPYSKSYLFANSSQNGKARHIYSCGATFTTQTLHMLDISN